MKIKEVHVAGFGCLKELALKFGDSINVILAPNDEGKSTLQCFITAILYPFSDTKERERFKPWTANTYGGRLTYLLSSGKEFIIHKMIRERASKDELKLYGSEDGKEVDKDLLDTHLGMNS
ncbi:MAG TPA: hypothetical protein EYP60_07940, partial [bacterium (Candidatus Stahlbacteria)]|nr:hypothetical protein [Candidatus Stahlbacteria bacterium]